jgi:hypothetical protein
LESPSRFDHKYDLETKVSEIVTTYRYLSKNVIFIHPANKIQKGNRVWGCGLDSLGSG